MFNSTLRDITKDKVYQTLTKYSKVYSTTFLATPQPVIVRYELEVKYSEETELILVQQRLTD